MNTLSRHAIIKNLDFMDTPIARRQFLRSAGTLAGLAAFPGLVRTAAAAQAASPGESAEGLTTYQLGPQIWIRWNNRLLTCYRAHRSQKYPYMYPVAGPLTGCSLTEETSLPWPHHRSLFFGCDRVNGGNYWQEGFDQGQILSTGPKLGKSSKTSVEILDACDWQKPGESPVMKDQRKITVTVASEKLYFIDWEIQWTAIEKVIIPKTNHSLFALRAAVDMTPSGGGQLLNAEGLSGEKATFGKPSAWCGFHGKRERVPGSVVEGIALFDHPGNPWPGCPWFTRDYGFISPTPFNFQENPWELAAGKSVDLRYRVVLHGGSPKEIDLSTVFRQWSR